MKSDEYKKRKALLNYEHKLKIERIELEHTYKMTFVKYIRDTERLKNDLDRERMRIKTAEIRKSQMRGDSYNSQRRT